MRKPALISSKNHHIHYISAPIVEYVVQKGMEIQYIIQDSHLRGEITSISLSGDQNLHVPLVVKIRI